MSFNIQLTPGLAQWLGGGQAHKVQNNDRFASHHAAKATPHKGALAYQLIPNNGLASDANLAGRFNRLA